MVEWQCVHAHTYHSPSLSTLYLILDHIEEEVDQVLIMVLAVVMVSDHENEILNDDVMKKKMN